MTFEGRKNGVVTPLLLLLFLPGTLRLPVKSTKVAWVEFEFVFLFLLTLNVVYTVNEYRFSLTMVLVMGGFGWWFKYGKNIID